MGTGNTGSEMIKLGQAIGMDVIAWTFHPSQEKADRLGIQYVSFEQLLQTADVISLHVKLTDESRHLIDKQELELMKQGALLINCARGEVVQTDALFEALDAGRLSGAGIDVYDQEPPPSDYPLLTCKQVILTPHCADMTPEGVDLLNQGAVNNIIAYIEGHPENIVS